MIGGIGIWELIIILVIILLLFGASRLKDIGKSLGEGIKGFKQAVKEDEEEPKKIAEAKPKELPESAEGAPEKAEDTAKAKEPSEK